MECSHHKIRGVVSLMIKKVYRFIAHKYIYNFENQHSSQAEQKAFISKLKTAEDDFDLAVDHYICVMDYFFPVWVRIILNIIGFFLWPVLFFVYFFKGIKKNELVSERKVTIVEGQVGIKDILPSAFSERYQNVEVVKKTGEPLIDKVAAKIFLKSAMCNLHRPYFNLIVLARMAEACGTAYAYQPEALCFYARERDFAVPLITLYCEKKGLEFVSFMHGDYLKTIDKSYMRFSKYYVWDSYYVEMFEELNWISNQFEVYLPQKLQGITKPRENDTYEYFATYYFGAESRKRIDGVKRAFDILNEHGYKCKVRPHPRFSDLEYLSSVFCDYVMEDCKTVSLEESLENSRYTVALNSTVLAQTYYSGKEFVIDDYSDPERYELLKERAYIMLNKPHKLLSELLENVD